MSQNAQRAISCCPLEGIEPITMGEFWVPCQVHCVTYFATWLAWKDSGNLSRELKNHQGLKSQGKVINDFTRLSRGNVNWTRNIRAEAVKSEMLVVIMNVGALSSRLLKSLAGEALWASHLSHSHAQPTIWSSQRSQNLADMRILSYVGRRKP